MPRPLLLIVLLLLLTLHLPAVIPAGARAVDPDPAAFLPPEAVVRQTVQGDLDGDGQDDQVSLYALPGYTATAPLRAGLLVLLAADGGERPLHLFGQPPADLRGEPVLDPSGSADLTLRDVAGDGHNRILLTVTNRFPNTDGRTYLWIFGAGEQPLPPDPDDHGPLPPAWAGTGFHIEAYLEGRRVEIEHHAPGAPSVLRREVTERTGGGPNGALILSETYRWQGDGFRVAERALRLTDANAVDASSPETAVISFYQAQARGDLAAATGLLGDELRAGRSATATTAAPDPSIRVEEVRLLDRRLTRQDQEPTERLVAFRVSMTDPRATPTTPESLPRRTTIGGTWLARDVGDGWRLVEANHHETVDITAISAGLPAGVSIVQTASGDLRGQGREDVAVLVTGPSRFALVEPYVLFASAPGTPPGSTTMLEPGRPLASYVPGGMLGGPFGTIDMADVNADGKQEVTFGGIVGAHAALLWVLQWDGSTLVPLFAESSNAPVVGLEDLNGDGTAEILLVQSGYCGSYAASPTMAFVFRWHDGGYQPASWRFPSVHEGVEDRAEDADRAHQGDSGSPPGPRACNQHMLALAHAFRGQPDAARTAYRLYSSLRQQTAADERAFVRPIYLGAEYVEADIRAVIAAAESGESPGWQPADRAVLFDLLGDALLARAQTHLYEAEDAVRVNQPDAEREARQRASAARQAATDAYRNALALDPTDEEARRALGEP